MEKPHILATKPGEYKGIRQIFAPLLEKHFTVVPYHEFEKNPNLWAHKIQAVIVWFTIPKISRDLLLSLPNLKAVISGGVGVDHLDIPLITSFGVKIANTPNIVDNATADIGMALLLASARKLIEGMGRIGHKIAKRAQGFDMKILYHNRKQREAEDEKAVGATYCAKIEDLLRESDFVMLSVNLSPETHKLIGKRELSLMKPTATLVNVSRGLVVDQDALVEALEDGVIYAAALDVTYPEPLPRNHPLLRLKNVLILPHMGTASYQTTRAMVERIIANTHLALEGSPLLDEVKPN
ncbi:glyoxylate/hydroxypyruvate reductase B-like isoform X2 [Polypterus senegalus]|uniref:glyoxylate/hydroxypyruvate reductase B-like isoform X2 n=1 Tax=Polypterus senegalus TaxID=55291 RepID=UPI0019646CFC|nr:glyoxylate/hydroxypyruvate reductase B-like isoform X2 [Polypterus senegalus]